MQGENPSCKKASTQKHRFRHFRPSHHRRCKTLPRQAHSRQTGQEPPSQPRPVTPLFFAYFLFSRKEGDPRGEVPPLTGQGRLRRHVPLPRFSLPTFFSREKKVGQRRAKAVSMACLTALKVSSTEPLRGISRSPMVTAMVPSASGRELKAASTLTLSA